MTGRNISVPIQVTALSTLRHLFDLITTEKNRQSFQAAGLFVVWLIQATGLFKGIFYTNGLD